MTTNLGRDEYLLLLFSIKSTAMFGSEMTRVGLRPTHIVKIGPYLFDHSWNCIQGFEVGSLFPKNGRGVGPGGMRHHFQISLIRIKSGTSAIPAKGYHELRIEKSDMAKSHRSASRFLTGVENQFGNWCLIRCESGGLDRMDRVVEVSSPNTPRIHPGT
jgi:hypothetical protein